MDNPIYAKTWYERAVNPNEKHSWYIKVLLFLWSISDNRVVWWELLMGKNEYMKPIMFRNFVFNCVFFLALASVFLFSILGGWINTHL
jgi:hypothetical protein